LHADKEELILKRLLQTVSVEQEKSKQHDAAVIPFKRSRFLQIAVAASVILVLTVGGFMFLKYQTTEKKIAKLTNQKLNSSNDVEPGGDKAILTFGDGSTIELDDAKNGDLASQGTTRVIKAGSKLLYNSGAKDTSEVVYNTITTPSGGQYQIELPDGTNVWLNAASSMRFPTSFKGSARTVDITGEAYFEVAKNKDKPFVVNVGSSHIKVLGTHFNVMAYDNEPSLKTTLLEGSINFESGSNSKIITPGQQTQLLKDGNLKVINDANIDKEMAWKNGRFNFDGVDIEALGRQLSRWYGVEMVYDKKPDEIFYLDIPRSMKLSKVLNALSLTGEIHFTIDGNKIMVHK
jgi:hypothetical protein